MKDTLQLPRTDFPMRAQLGEREPKRLLAWQHANVWAAVKQARANLPSFVLHDGPPYANGGLHQGHLLNKILKDIIVKDRSMAGFDVSFTPGWDCHGLPIETQVDKSLGAKKQEMGTRALHDACRQWAERFIDVQREGFKRLGVFGDWEQPYKTMAPSYQADIVRAFADLYETGLVFRGLRPVHWCTTHQTALAEAEVEYEDKESHSILVALRVANRDRPRALAQAPQHLDLVIWTTTPWSLPGNVAVVAHPETEYVIAPVGDRHVIVAAPLYASFVRMLKDGAQASADIDPAWPKLAGRDLSGLTYEHPFLPRTGIVTTDLFVTMDAGTGLVHSAPAHGQEDFAVAQKAGLAVISPVDARGIFNEEAGPFAGQHIFKASKVIVERLAETGHLLSDPLARIRHRYAHCWRCHQPLITRATEQWFLAMDKEVDGQASLRARSLKALSSVTWIPAWGVERIGGMLKNRPDWCLSRQRTWGVALPIAYCERCEQPFADAQAMRHAADVVERAGAASLATLPAEQLLGQGLQCAHCSGTSFRMGGDILDVWFDSGVSWYAALQDRGDEPRADLYLEGSDQHRGWFHSSLLTSVALRDQAPYKQCLTHGFVVDGQGKKISKSRGNFVDPFASIDKEGAEIWRLWAASEDYQQDVRLSPVILRQLSDHYRKMRNTLRYLLGALFDFEPNKELVDADKLMPLDAWALGECVEMTSAVRDAFGQYQFHVGMQRLMDFCNVFLSAFYLDVLKDRLYASAKGGLERKSAQTVLYVMAADVIRLLAPVLAFTADEAWEMLPHLKDDHTCVHVGFYPGMRDAAPLNALRDGAQMRAEQTAASFSLLKSIRKLSNGALEQARREKIIGSSTEARAVIAVGEDHQQRLAQLPLPLLIEALIVSDVAITAAATSDMLDVRIERAPGHKCERCWLVKVDATPAAGKNAICDRCKEVLN